MVDLGLDGSSNSPTGGGIGPVWSRNGRELFYRDPSGSSVYAVAFDPDPGVPAELFRGAYLQDYPFGRNYDVGPDGRFLLLKRTRPRSRGHTIRMVVNWTEELRRSPPK